MKNQDEEIIEQIKSVFNDIDDGNSDAGWLLLREKYPEKSNRKFPIWWISGVAAALLVLIGFFYNHIPQINGTTRDQLLVKKPSLKQEEEDKSATTAQAPIDVLEQEKAANNSSSPMNQKLAQKAIVKNAAATGFIDLKTAVVVKAQNASINPIKTDTILQTKETVVPIVTKELPKERSEVLMAKKTTAEFLQEQTALLQKNGIKQEKNNPSGTTSIDVFTGTFVNYFADNEAKVNAGFGLNANIKVAKSVFLTVGAGISQNKISYQNSLPVSVASAVVENTMINSKATGVVSVTDIKVNARLINIDLPITLKFYPTKKQNFYIATGINSNSYLSQKYVSGYELNNDALSFSSVAEPKQEVEKSQFKGFDFANSAIFAIGINQDLGKRNSLIFEPYFKPAIGSMGDKNLRINSVGLNLKFSFKANPKK